MNAYKNIPVIVVTPEHELARCYGHVGPFKNGLAAVVSGKCAFHIHLNGVPAYGARFVRVEDFHEGAAVVVNEDDEAFHIGFTGEPLYHERWDEAHCFYEGVAVVAVDGKWYLIGRDGMPIHEGCFKHAGRMHNGAAVVTTEEGSFHVGHDGRRIHQHAFDFLVGGIDSSAGSMIGAPACRVDPSSGSRVLTALEFTLEKPVPPVS